MVLRYIFTSCVSQIGVLLPLYAVRIARAGSMGFPRYPIFLKSCLFPCHGVYWNSGKFKILKALKFTNAFSKANHTCYCYSFFLPLFTLSHNAYILSSANVRVKHFLCEISKVKLSITGTFAHFSYNHVYKQL